MSREGLLVVVSGPAGVGKGTICKAYMKKFKDMKLSVSATTRQPRQGEKNGVEYHFKTREEFEKMIENDELLEYVNVFDNYYGTPKKWIEDEIKEGHDVILEIEIVGAMKVRKLYPKAVLIFIMPPSYKVLEERLKKRNQDSEDQIRKRLARTVEEVNMMMDYDYFVVNDDLDKALEAIKNVIDSERFSVKRYGQQSLKEYLQECQ